MLEHFALIYMALNKAYEDHLCPQCFTDSIIFVLHHICVTVLYQLIQVEDISFQVKIHQVALTM